MKYLITGIDGFAGKHLTKYLRTNDADIYGLHLHKQPEETDKNIYECDITDAKSITGIIAQIKPDIIIHLAALADVASSWKNVNTTFKVNLTGTINILEAVRQNNLNETTILNVCSGDIYGKAKENIITEETPLNPQNPYAVSKTSVDYMSKVYAKHLGLQIVTARSFNHSGPAQAPAFVISDFARQVALIEKGMQAPIIKTGNLESFRDFTDVRDIVKAYVLLGQKGKSGESYNVASSKLYKISNILAQLIDFSDKEIETTIDKDKLRPTDPKTTKISIDKIKKDTGWEPEIDIKTTLLDTLNWWRGNL